jgi:hypothetical protein
MAAALLAGGHATAHTSVVCNFAVLGERTEEAPAGP